MMGRWDWKNGDAAAPPTRDFLLAMMPPEDTVAFFKGQTKFHFINEFSAVVIAEWVLQDHLDLFCKENRYAEWKRAKKRALRKLLLEAL